MFVNLKILDKLLQEDLKNYHKNLISEDIKSAKTFLEKRGVPLNHPDFLKIRNEWFPNNVNFIFPFVKFRFGDEEIRMSDLQQLVNSVKTIKLPKPINQYKKFEELVDDVNSEEAKLIGKEDENKIRDFVREIPSTQYSIIKQFSKEEYEDFKKSVKRISTDPGFTDLIKKRLFGQIAIFQDNKDKEDLLNFFKNFRIVNKENEFNEALSLIGGDENAELIYKNEDIGVIVARVYSFEAAQKLACDTSHCIKNVRSFWETYNPSPLQTAQYYIWLTDKPNEDPNRKIGITVTKDNKYKSGGTQNVDNKDIRSELNNILNSYGISDVVKYRVPNIKYIKSFIESTIEDGNVVSDELFKTILDSVGETDILNYLFKLGSQNKKLPEQQLNLLSDKQKITYLKTKADKGYRLSDIEFNYVIDKNPESLKEYFNSKVERKETLNDTEFVYILNFLPNKIGEVLKYYNQKNIKLTPLQFKYLSSFDKGFAQSYIEDNELIEKSSLNPEQFFFLVKNDKKKALQYLETKMNKMLQDKKFVVLPMIEFGFLTQVRPDLAKIYTDLLLSKKYKKLSKQEFEFIKTNYNEKVLVDFIKGKLGSSIFKDKSLSDDEITFAKNNNLMEQKLRTLIKKLLKEKVDYEEIFDDETLKKIKDKSISDYRDKNLHQSFGDVMSSLPKIKNIEKEHKSKLEDLAVDFVKKQFPIITKNNIEIDAKLQDRISVSAPERKKELSNPDRKDKASKRRIINAITQGASVSTHGIHHIVDELNDINSELIGLYDKIGKGNDVIFALGDPKMLIQGAIQANKLGMSAGYSQAIHDGNTWKIVARAQTFPVLIHEIVKGLYELISLYGLSDDKDEREDVLGNVDNIESEIDDLKYGKIIYQKIRDYIFDVHYDKFEEYNEIIEEFLKDLYQLPEQEFLRLMNGLINDNPNRTRLDRIILDVYNDLKDDDKDSLDI